MASVLSLFIFVVVYGSLCSACPAFCNCRSAGEKISVNCRNTTLDGIPIDLPLNTTAINLSGSPVACNCAFYRRWKELKDRNIEVIGKCMSPLQLSGKSLDDLSDDSFQCMSLTSQSSTTQPQTAAGHHANRTPSQSRVMVFQTAAEHDASPTLSQSSVVVDQTAAEHNSKSTSSKSSRAVLQTVAKYETSRTSTAIPQAAAEHDANPTSTRLPSTETVFLVPSSSEAFSRSLVRTSILPQALAHSPTSSLLRVSVTGTESSVVVSSSIGVMSLLESHSLSSSQPPVARATKYPLLSSLQGNAAIPTAPFSPAVVSSSMQPHSSVLVHLVLSTMTVSNVSSVANRTELSSPALPTYPPKPRPGPARIVDFYDNRTVALNSIVSVNCTARGNPSPNVDVTLEGMGDVSVTKWEAGVQITFLAKRSSEIHCVATNQLGRDNRKMKIIVNQSNASYIIFKVKLVEEKFEALMDNKKSKEFRDLASQITSAVRSVLTLLPGFLGASVIKLEPGSVKADVLIKTLRGTEDSVEKKLRADLEKAKLGDLKVDRYLSSFERTSACPSEHVNATWNDAVYGDMDVQPCPRGAKGFAKRNCSSFGWYFPDYTECKTDDFTKLKNQLFQSTSQEANTALFEQNALSILQDLLNLTSPNEDYAVMAGDIITCTEILEQLVSFLEKENKDAAHSDIEAQTVVKVSSNILHLHNEQEFIVAQKVQQTASRFIRVLEQYGLQAARIMTLPRGRYLATSIAENVVMGAGITRPDSITKDITFPNYNWPELAEVKKQWKATTFVSIDREMIKKMTTDNEGIRVAAFLYRTLTRILSVESAYSNVGLDFEINSAVISASMMPKPDFKLSEPVIIASNNLDEVDLNFDDEPICAFWDFNMNPPHGGWSEDGCNISAYNRLQTTCQCDHMTNFAVLRKMPIPPVEQKMVETITDFIHCIFISCWIIIAFAGITFLILLIFSPWLKPDRTWAMHMMVCVSIIVAFVLILLGLAMYNNLFLCNLFSLLVHYFFLCAFSWILAESVYMAIWNSANGPLRIYWVGYCTLGWGLPGIAVIVTWLLNGLVGFESYMSCWMSLFNPLVWVFFIPALVFVLISCIIFFKVWRAVTGTARQRLKGKYWKTRFRVHIRYSIILMLMFLITWLVGILLVTYYWKALLCVLFIICCTITGFMIFLFYVIMDRQVRDAIRHCCCYCRRGRRGSYWVRGDDLWIEKSPEPLEHEIQEGEQLVPEAAAGDQQDEIELNGFGKEGHDVESPLLKLEARAELQDSPPMQSSQESFDPLYERLRGTVEVEVEPIPPEEVEESKIEPIYAKVVKQKPPRHPESDSDDDDLTPEEREARGIRGLTREQVIRMAKKSDASKRVLKQYESPSSSRDDLDRPTYLLNQKELDEELTHFRTFFAQAKAASPTSSEPPTSTPKPHQGPSTSFESTSSSTKKETTTSVTKKTKDDSSYSFESHSKEESSSMTVTKKTMSQDSQPSETHSKEETEKSLETSTVSSKPTESQQETEIDASLEELDRVAEEDGNASSRPTAVSADNANLRSSLLSYFASTHQDGGDTWEDLLEALKE